MCEKEQGAGAGGVRADRCLRASRRRFDKHNQFDLDKQISFTRAHCSPSQLSFDPTSDTKPT